MAFSKNGVPQKLVVFLLIKAIIEWLVGITMAVDTPICVLNHIKPDHQCSVLKESTVHFLFATSL